MMYMMYCVCYLLKEQLILIVEYPTKPGRNLYIAVSMFVSINLIQKSKILYSSQREIKIL